MTRMVIVTLSICLLTAGCQSASVMSRRPKFVGGFPEYDCPEALQGQVQLTAEAIPVDAASIPDREQSQPTVGAVGRRIAAAVTPAGLDRDDRIVWSSLSISPFGGTFTSRGTLRTDYGVYEPNGITTTTRQPRTARAEIATVSSSPGQVKITRVANGQTNLAGTQAVDVKVVPGGVLVDDTVLRAEPLWTDAREPIAPEQVQLAFVAVRHPPGYDVVNASLQLDYIVRVARTGEEWSCSAEAQLSLVDQDAVRQPFWDLGLAATNAVRTQWIALFESGKGVIRAIFDSPESAHTLATWLQRTQATRIGKYEIGVVSRKSRVGRPFGPLDAEAMSTFRALTPADFKSITVGPVGE